MYTIKECKVCRKKNHLHKFEYGYKIKNCCEHTEKIYNQPINKSTANRYFVGTI